MYEKDEEKDDVQKIYSYLPPKAVLVLRIIELILFAFQLAIVGERPVQDQACEEKADDFCGEVVVASAIEKGNAAVASRLLYIHYKDYKRARIFVILYDYHGY